VTALIKNCTGISEDPIKFFTDAGFSRDRWKPKAQMFLGLSNFIQ